jgi:hypothetical protein
MAERRKFRFRFRYTLRALLVLITLAAMWCGYHSYRARSERAALLVLNANGVKVTLDPHKSNAEKLSFSAVYHRTVGEYWGERFVSSIEVTTTMKPSIAHSLSSLPYLRVLHIIGSQSQGSRCKLPDGTLRPILRNCDLSTLTLTHCDICASDLDSLSQEKTLRILDLSNTNLSEDELVTIITLPSLESFTFSDCSVSGRNLVSAPGSQSLTDVNCMNTPVSTEFAAFVGRSHNLVILALSHPSIDDEFIEALGPHPALNSLWLSESSITDASIPYFEQMKALEFLTVGQERFTIEGARELRASKPDLQF